MKRLGWIPSIFLVFSLGFLGCEQRGPEQSKNEDRAVAGAPQKSFQHRSFQLVKEEWRKGKELGHKAGNRLGDEWIHGMVVAKLIADSTTPEREISVEVDNRVVTLRGRVESVEQKKEAERVAKQTRGVKQVNNRLDVSA